MKKVIKEAREQSGICITHLLPLSAMLEVIEENAITFGDAWRTALAYKKALSQPLTLSQFVPCDSEGKPMEKPINNRPLDSDGKFMFMAHAYEQAQKAVLFEGFVWNDKFKEVQSKNWKIRFSTSRIFLDKNVGDNLFVGSIINNPILKALAENTKDNPLKLKQ